MIRCSPSSSDAGVLQSSTAAAVTCVDLHLQRASVVELDTAEAPAFVASMSGFGQSSGVPQGNPSNKT